MLAGLDDRYFSVLIKYGGVESTWLKGMAPWESSLLLCTEAVVDHTIEPSVGERKIKTPEEWADALTTSEREGTTFRVWIRLGLADLVKEAAGWD